MFFYLQCPPIWTTLQAVVCPGKNPLPAEVRIKAHPTQGEEFYLVDQWKWYSDPMVRKDYVDPVQIEMRKLISRGLVLTFSLFTYKHDPLIDKYVPELPLPHDACIGKVIEIVKLCQGICVSELDAEIIQLTGTPAAAFKNHVLDRFRKTTARISSGYIARLLLDAISTFQVCKNWNSHGALLGATLCQIGSMLSCLDTAAKGELINVDFNELIPRGNVQTGHKHGHHEVSYVEYMTSGKERSPTTGAEHPYLDHMRFRGDHHDVKVREIMGRELDGVKAPVPRPTRAHTFDFNMSYKGARLLDGECKGVASEDDKAVLVLHSLDQLAFQDKALCLLTTNNSFTFYSSWFVYGANYIQTCYHELRKFKLEPIAKLDVDLDKDAGHLPIPPRFSITGDGEEFIETNTNILNAWTKLRSEVRQFISSILHAVDVIADELSEMKFEEVAQKRQTAYTSGWREPNFHSGDSADSKNNRKIRNQEEYIYCRKTMEGEDSDEHYEKANKQLYEGFKQILDSNVQMSAEMRAAVEYSVNRHKPPNA